MGLKSKRTVKSVNRNIDRAIDISGMEVDRGIEKFMVKKKKSARIGTNKKDGSIFEVGNGKRTLLG